VLRRFKINNKGGDCSMAKAMGKPTVGKLFPLEKKGQKGKITGSKKGK